MTAAANSVTVVDVAAMLTAVIALWGLLGTSRGRGWAKRLYRGESLQTVAATFADQMAATEAAYNISEAERRRLEAKVNAQVTELADLRKQIEFLGSLVTSREEVRELAATEADRHDRVMGAITALAAEMARLSGRGQPR